MKLEGVNEREGDKVLIVEDNESCYILLKEYLIILGFECVRAKNSVEVMEIFKKTKIDLAFVDLRLSINESGVDIIKQIKNINPEIPVIIQTAVISHEEREKCYIAGCDEYLTKPFTFNVFYKAFEKHVHAKSA